jgi:molecular chaperone GrpE
MIFDKKERPADGSGPQKPAAPDDVPGSPNAEGKKQPAEMIEVDAALYDKTVRELADYKDRYVRLYAEFDNTRKRYERDRQEFVKYANEGLLADFLNILDDLERAVQAATTKHEDYDAFLKGVELVMGRITDLLKKQDIKPIEAVGKKFDPHCHEILLQVPSAEHEEGTVMEELQRGYYYGERVIRTTKVKVAVKPRQEEEKA